MATRIDGFAHALPKSFVTEFNEAHDSEELAALQDADRFWDMNIRLELMDEYDIDKQVINLARPPIWQGIDPHEAAPMVELANDGIRELADRHDELIPVATLPFGGQHSLDEFRRCIDELEMAGVQLFSNVQGQPVDQAYEGLFKLIDDRDVPVWLHPQLHKWYPWDDDFMLHKVLGWPFDTSMALSRLLFSGVMDQYPDLDIIAHHMAAMIPHFTDRIEHFQSMLSQHRDVYPYEVPDIEEGKVANRFSQFYGDTCRGGNADILEDGNNFFGDGGLIFATDYPFGPDKGEGFVRSEVTGVSEMDVSREQRANIFGNNLAALL